jgi:DNA-binding transcriptional LysR family regulator
MPMDLDALRAFVKVAELGSFTKAGAQLGVGKARVSLRLRALEGDLGTRLVQRSTRLVALTSDGEALLPRARRLVLEADDVASMFHGARALRGSVRIDLPVSFARDLIIPRLPELLARHPGLELVVSSTDRRVEASREGFDCVLRVGAPADPALTGRRLGALRMANCASTAYLRRHGAPARIEDLDHHLVVHYASTPEAPPPSFEYEVAGRVYERPMRAIVTVNNAEAYTAACLAGLGIVQVPRSGMVARLEAGIVEEVLPSLVCPPMPVTLLHTHARNVPRRVRAVMNWLEEVMGARLRELERAGLSVAQA